jgi:hypothetical protein
VGFPLAVLYKYIDDSGGYLAALIAYYGFVSARSRSCCLTPSELRSTFHIG